MTILLIDTHAHFDTDAFTHDRAAALQRAQAAGVQAQIVPAISAATWPQLKAVCQAHTNLFPAYGLHPMCLQAHLDQHLQALDRWLQQEPAVAVGECGLDFYLKALDPKRQTALFVEQLQLAKQHRLPVIIHARRAVDQVYKYLRQVGDTIGVVHSFAGSEQQARQLLDLGYYLGFGGPITYPRAKRLRRLIQVLPLDRLLLETDAPDQPLCGRQGQRNEPAFLPAVLHTIAELRQQSAAEIAAATTQNAIRLFQLPC